MVEASDLRQPWGQWNQNYQLADPGELFLMFEEGRGGL